MVNGGWPTGGDAPIRHPPFTIYRSSCLARGGGGGGRRVALVVVGDEGGGDVHVRGGVQDRHLRGVDDDGDAAALGVGFERLEDVGLDGLERVAHGFLVVGLRVLAL